MKNRRLSLNHNVFLAYFDRLKKLSVKSINGAVSVVYNRQLNFHIKGLSHDDPMVNFYFKNALVSTFSYTTKNINKILKKSEKNYSILFDNRK